MPVSQYRKTCLLQPSNKKVKQTDQPTPSTEAAFLGKLVPGASESLGRAWRERERYNPRAGLPDVPVGPAAPLRPRYSVNSVISAQMLDSAR